MNIDKNEKLRILGKGKTALSIKEKYQEASLFDDNDKDIYDITSEEITVVSPGIPPHNYLVKNSKNIISDYDLFLNDSIYSIWISGTNGKTTTTQMLYQLLKEEGFGCGGNIGTPLAKIKDIDKLILETSSFTLHYTNNAKPNIYILLPISEDHIYWHGDFKSYEDAKLKPLRNMVKSDIAIIPFKYKNINTNAQVYYYKDTIDLAKQFEINLGLVSFKEPFLQDAILALAVAKIYTNKIDYKNINRFKQDAHKLEEFKDAKNKLWVDDSKATNIDATINALKVYKDKYIYLILGGDDKGVELDSLFEELKKYEVFCYFIGSNSKRLEEYALKYDINSTKTDKIEKAVELMSKIKPSDNSVFMLSPAAASLDQFESYKHRGEQFKIFVNSFNN